MQNLVRRRPRVTVSPIATPAITPIDLPDTKLELEALAIKLAFRPREDRWELGRVMAKLHEKMDGEQFQNFCRTNLQVGVSQIHRFIRVSEIFSKAQVRQFGITKCWFIGTVTKTQSDRRRALDMAANGDSTRKILNVFAPERLPRIGVGAEGSASFRYIPVRAEYSSVSAAALKLNRKERAKLMSELFNSLKSGRRTKAA